MNKGLKEKIITLYNKGYSYNEICKILNCTKGTVSYHISFLAKEKIKNKIKEKKDKIDALKKEISHLSKEEFIELYKNKLPLRLFYKIQNEVYSSLIVKNILTSSEYHANRRRNIKKELINIKGGSCQLCGYNKCLRSLEFHHLDPTKKDFTISKNMKSIKKEILLKELDKCILVCSNCHGEIHDNIIRVDTKVD